ncbi:hypothetical protein Tco_0755642 [Tanacetum coccineum]
MSDLEDSTVTYMAVSSPFEGLSHIGSLGVDGPPLMPEDPYAYVVAAFQAPSSPDYVPGPEEPEHEFVPEPVYPEFMPPEDDVLPAKEQPLPTAISPTADSPGYIVDSDLEEDPEEDLEEDPINYPAERGDDDDDDDESSDDDEDDDDDVEEDEDEEEEHPAPSNSVPPPVHRVTARMSIRDEPPTPFWYEAEISRLLAKPSPPPSPLSPLSSPLPQIPSPPLPVLSPVLVSPPLLPASPTYPLGYRATMIRQRDDRIVDWKTYTLTENFMYYQIFRGDGSSKNYKILSEMLEDFDRQDVEELYILVKERYSASRPEGYDLMLWGDLHTLFEPDEEDEIWKNQHEYNVISWSLYDFCGIHILLMQNGIAIHMLTKKKYPLSQEMISKMLKKKLKVDHESSYVFELLRFIRSQVQK